MSALDVSLVPRVSLRLGYRSRPIRICNDMSLSLLPFLSIFTGFQHNCLKVGTFGIIADFDCHLHQRLACLVVKLSFVSLGLYLTILTFKACSFHLFGYQQIFVQAISKSVFILMVSKPEPTNNQNL